MSERRKISKKFRWLRRLKRRLFDFFSPKPKVRVNQPVRKRKRRSKRRLRSQSFSLLESGQGLRLLFQPKQSKKRSRKKSLGKRLRWRWTKFIQNVAQWNQTFLVPQKKRRRRKRKQYAVYVMSNQKKID